MIYAYFHAVAVLDDVGIGDDVSAGAGNNSFVGVFVACMSMLIPSSWCMFVDVHARRRGCSRHCSCCRCSSVNDVVVNVGGRAGAVHPFAAVFVGVVGPLPLLFIRS